jgi:signal transduction histidine kinase
MTQPPHQPQTHEHLERELARRSRQVAALSRIARDLAGSLNVVTTARAGLTNVLEIAEMDAGEILLWDEHRGELVQCVHAGARAEAFMTRTVFRRGEGLVGAALESGQMLSMDGGLDRRRLMRPELADAGFQSILVLPLLAEGRTIGVMNLASFAHRALDAETDQLLTGLGGQIGTALDRARSYERERELSRRLEALNEATLAIAEELLLPKLLQRITDIARDLTDAKYAALGVTGDDGPLAEFITSGISDEQRARMGPPPEGHGVLAQILHGTRPVRLSNIEEYPGSRGVPASHPRMRSFLGVPIVLRGKNLGDLYLAEKQHTGAFTEDDERLLLLLAAHAAIAIEHARLYSRTSESLQQRVAELREANSQLAHLSSLALRAQEEERRRLARELHDDTAQALASLLIRLRVLERTEDPRELRGRVHEFREVIARALDDVRRMAIDLRPTTLDDLGLVPAVEAHARTMAERWGFKARVRVNGLDVRLPSEIELVAYRIVQEALSNIAKHAHATEVSVFLERRDRTLHITVHDNGQGFDVEQTLASKDRGLGLFGMQERATLVGGRVELRSTFGEGTTVEAAIPIREPSDPGKKGAS